MEPIEVAGNTTPIVGVDQRLPSLGTTSYFTAGTGFADEIESCHDPGAYAEDQQAVLFGRDEILLSGLVLGARGAVGSTYNYMAPIYNKLMAYYASGELAGAHAQQIRSMEIIAIMVKHGGLSAGKAIMKMIGLDCGPTRAPLRTLSIKQESALRSELRKADFFHACSLNK